MIDIAETIERVLRRSPLFSEQGCSFDEPIGRGKFGTVYRAGERAVKRISLQKILDEAGGEIGSHYLARVAANLVWVTTKNPEGVNLPEVLSFDGETIAIASRYAPSRLDIKKQDPRSGIIQAAASLAALHGVGALHRDIKPKDYLLWSDAGSWGDLDTFCAVKPQDEWLDRLARELRIFSQVFFRQFEEEHALRIGTAAYWSDRLFANRLSPAERNSRDEDWRAFGRMTAEILYGVNLSPGSARGDRARLRSRWKRRLPDEQWARWIVAATDEHGPLEERLLDAPPEGDFEAEWRRRSASPLEERVSRRTVLVGGAATLLAGIFGAPYIIELVTPTPLAAAAARAKKADYSEESLSAFKDAALEKIAQDIDYYRAENPMNQLNRFPLGSLDTDRKLISVDGASPSSTYYLDLLFNAFLLADDDRLKERFATTYMDFAKDQRFDISDDVNDESNPMVLSRYASVLSAARSLGLFEQYDGALAEKTRVTLLRANIAGLSALSLYDPASGLFYDSFKEEEAFLSTSFVKEGCFIPFLIAYGKNPCFNPSPEGINVLLEESISAGDDITNYLDVVFGDLSLPRWDSAIHAAMLRHSMETTERLLVDSDGGTYASADLKSRSTELDGFDGRPVASFSHVAIMHGLHARLAYGIVSKKFPETEAFYKKHLIDGLPPIIMGDESGGRDAGAAARYALVSDDPRALHAVLAPEAFDWDGPGLLHGAVISTPDRLGCWIETDAYLIGALRKHV